MLTIHRQPKGYQWDWAKLHPDLLHLISKKMDDVSNLIHFRAVCKDWRFAADATDAPAELPWLIWPTVLPGTIRCTRTTGSRWDNEYFVYSFSSNTVRQIRFPLSHEPYFEGASNGFTLFFEYPSSPLPLSLFTDTTYNIQGDPNFFYYRITWFNHDPNTKSRNMSTKVYSVGYKLTPHGKTIRIRYVDSAPRWTVIRNVSIEFPSGPVAIGHYKGRLFLSLSIPRVTWIFDATTGTKSSVEIPHPNEYVNFHFFIDVMGEFLGVMQFVVEEDTLYGKKMKYDFIVYLLEHTDDFGYCRWSKFNVVDNEIFFIFDRPTPSDMIL
jgi:hypothetical protein